MRCDSSIEALRQRARRRLPRFAFDFIDGGSGTENALRRNRESLDRIRLLPRVGVNCERRSAGISLFGVSYDLPLGIAPIGMADLAWPKTNLAFAQTAQAARIPYVLSTAANMSIEKTMAITPAWFQLYVGRDQAKTENLLSRAESAGVQVLVVTVDVPVAAKRLRDLQNGLTLPLRPSLRMSWDLLRHPSWSLHTLFHGRPRFANFEATQHARRLSFAEVMSSQICAALDWQRIAKLRERWPHKLVLKGILRTQDATQALTLGIDGLMVSNHGGRQLDSAPGAIEVLADISNAVGRRITLMFDGGIRSGEDIAKALALGAQCVFAGRPFLYGAAAVGASHGVRAAVNILADEFDRAQAQLGCAHIADFDAQLVQCEYQKPDNRQSGSSTS